MTRTIAIWIFGLIGSAMIGQFITNQVSPVAGDQGFFTGIFVFACLRLWLAAPPRQDL